MTMFDCSLACRNSHDGGCAKQKLEKSDKILAVAPWIFAAAAAIQIVGDIPR
jgi:hypothetical protein